MLKSWNDVVLREGGHNGPHNGMCVMEAVSWFTGGQFTESPRCVPERLRTVMYAMNDHAPTIADRQGLKPLIPYLVNSPEIPDDLYHRFCATIDWKGKFRLLETWLTSNARNDGLLMEREVVVPVTKEENSDQTSGVA